jgi:hypothetical protein
MTLSLAIASIQFIPLADNHPIYIPWCLLWCKDVLVSASTPLYILFTQSLFDKYCPFSLASFPARQGINLYITIQNQHSWLFTVCTVIYFAMCGRSAVAAPPE